MARRGIAGAKERPAGEYDWKEDRFEMIIRFNHRKKAEETMVDAQVWCCSSSDCRIWMRQEFTLDPNPSCPVCGAEMHLANRRVPPMGKSP